MSIFDQLTQGVHCPDASTTHHLGMQLARAMPDNQVLTLSGPIGSGKTTLSKGIGAGLGLNPERITSPSYNLYNLHQGSRQLVHVDAYRLNSPSEVEALFIEDFLSPPWLLILEWPEHGVADWMQSLRWDLQLSRHPETGLTVRLLKRPD
jgi:tRNA threonylcarbamoyladenosine biosynthesis protein TsaE